MRKGYDAQVLLNKKGQILAIGTGSDATAEHEQGSKPLMSALCRLYDNEAQVLKKLNAHLHRGGIHQRLASLIGQGDFVYPNVLESKRIVKPDALQFTVTRGEKGSEAFFGLCRHPLTEWTRELTFPASFRTTGVNPDVAGAWDESSFGIRVRGEKLVAALKELHEATLAGKVVFGGTFLAARKGQRLSGVVLANESLFTEADRQQVEKAQAEYESGLRLKCLDDSRELMRELYKMQPTLNLGFLWARWRDAQESAIGYFLNPGYGLKADYGGPYTREQLVDWVKSGCSYQLKRQEA